MQNTNKRKRENGALVFSFSRFLVFSFWWLHLSGHVAVFTFLDPIPIYVFARGADFGFGIDNAIYVGISSFDHINEDVIDRDSAF